MLLVRSGSSLVLRFSREDENDWCCSFDIVRVCFLFIIRQGECTRVGRDIGYVCADLERRRENDIEGKCEFNRECLPSSRSSVSFNSKDSRLGEEYHYLE